MKTPLSGARRAVLLGTGAMAIAAPFRRALAQTAVSERLAYVGSYTPNGEGITLWRVNAETGAMSLAKSFGGIENPSWIALDAGRRVLYAVNENEPSGAVSAFAVDKTTGALAFINKVDSRGKWPCHISVHASGKFVLVANYGGGSVAVLPILANGGVGDPTDLVTDTGPLNPATAADSPPGNFSPSDHAGPRMHMVQCDPSGRFVIANDAGRDRTLIWTLDLATGKLVPAATPSVASTPGSAPRHFVFSEDGLVFYNLHEQDGILTVSDFDPATGALSQKQAISVLPKGFAGSNVCSELALSPNGRFMYAGCRGHNSISVLAVGDGGRLTWAGEAWTRSDIPRSFSIDPAGRFLFVCNQKGELDDLVHDGCGIGRARVHRPVRSGRQPCLHGVPGVAQFGGPWPVLRNRPGSPGSPG